MLFMGIFFVAFFAYIALLYVGATLVIPGILDNTCAECEAVLLVITPYPIPILTFVGIPFLIWYIFVVVIISICFFWLIVKDMPTVLADFSSALRKGTSISKSRSSWMTLARLFSFAIFFNVAYNLVLLLAFGEDFLPTGSETGPTWYFLYAVANAAFWEEIISRTLLIGVPLLIIALIRHRKVEKPLRYFIGGGFKIGIPESVLLFFSAFMFATAHIFSSGAAVFPPLFVGGLVLGYLFLKKGIVTSILFHFGWNYSIALNTLASVSGNVPLLALGLALNLFLAFIGFVFAFQYVAKFVIGYQKRARAMTESYPVTQPRYHTQPSGAPHAARYQCPNCGGVLANYKEGRFQCLRCGHFT